MSKIYAFVIIIPIVVILMFKSVALYEYDTTQRYIKNYVDDTARKVMITGVMTLQDKNNLLSNLNKFGTFKQNSIITRRGNSVDSEATMTEYAIGSILSRGEYFCIYVKSDNESTLSRLEGDTNKQIFYKARAICRIERPRYE